MHLSHDEIREWTEPRQNQPAREPSPGAATATRLEGARLLARHLGRRLPAMRSMLEHEIESIAASLPPALETP